jgi:hypothetical protein
MGNPATVCKEKIGASLSGASSAVASSTVAMSTPLMKKIRF